MNLLDTNVLSEFRKDSYHKADPRVVAWANSQRPEQLFISVITLFEVEKGAQLMERRDQRQGLVLRAWIESKLMPAFSGRIISVDDRIAALAASFHVPNPAPFADSLIAATAIIRGFTVVTRNAGDFQYPGVTVMNPWNFA
jgi:toxin FitB